MVDRNSDPDFYNVVLEGWEPANPTRPMRGFSSVGDCALWYSVVDEAAANGRNESNNPFNNVALYDPANPDINIIDLDAQAYVAWELNNNGGWTYTGVRTATGYDDIWHYQRNYFNGEAPDLEYFTDIFGADLAGLTEEGAGIGDWNLMSSGTAVYHCGDNGETCFKFTNDVTGQEYVYIDGHVTNDVAVLGTYNYALDAGRLGLLSPSSGHLWVDMKQYWLGGNTGGDPTAWWDRIRPIDDPFTPPTIPSGILAPKLPVNPEKL